ncbi:MAG: hypothetical protein V7765_09530 [Oleispira sp.]
MKNQAILTLLVDKQDVLKVGPDRLSPRGCEFVCSEKQVALFRDEGSSLNQSRYANFQIRLGLFPHSGPRPQYVTAVGQITSVRRSAQDCYRIMLQFEQVSPDGYRLIAEHLSDSVVTLINSVQSQSA